MFSFLSLFAKVQTRNALWWPEYFYHLFIYSFMYSLSLSVIVTMNSSTPPLCDVNVAFLVSTSCLKGGMMKSLVNFLFFLGATTVRSVWLSLALMSFLIHALAPTST